MVQELEGFRRSRIWIRRSVPRKTARFDHTQPSRDGGRLDLAMSRSDPHSYADDTQAQTESFALVANVDFASHVITATVTLAFRVPATGRLDLDTRDLPIDHVEDERRQRLAFE